jgi:hypothetical protein
MMRPLNQLTGQTKLALGEAEGDHLAAVPIRIAFAAVSPHLTWPPRPNWPIVIW